MGRREELNIAYLWGCLLVAALVGLIAQSWPLFWLTLAIAIGTSVQAGGIRHRQDTRPRRQGR